MKNLISPRRQKDLPKLEKVGVEIVFDPQEDDLNIFDQFDDNKIAQDVADRYNNGNAAAWFCAHLIVKYREFEEDDYLGGCSYNSFKEFTSADKDYYMDMISQCVDRINKAIDSHNFEVQRAWNIRKANNLIAPYALAIYPLNLSAFKVA